jgi:uncharacterized membrane protein
MGWAHPLMLAIAIWVHVLAAVVWIGACAALALAAGALRSGAVESADFARRALPRLVRLNAVAAALVLAGGGVSLAAVGGERGYRFPPLFIEVLAMKASLYFGMLWTLSATARTQASIGDHPAEAGQRWFVRIAALSGAAVVLGGIALALGLLLAGTLERLPTP